MRTPGRWAALWLTGADRGEDDQAGANSGTGPLACESCPPGTSSKQGSVACDECEAGKYAANAGQSLCNLCPHPLSSANGSVTCSFCKTEYYLQDPPSNSGDILTSPTEFCKPCPPNAACLDNTTLSSLVLPPGFWRASPSSAVLTECRLVGGGAKAGKTRCASSDGAERGLSPSQDGGAPAPPIST